MERTMIWMAPDQIAKSSHGFFAIPAQNPAHVKRLENRRNELREELSRVVPQKTDVVWEIGCGHGHFLTAYAQANPTRLCIGIDIARDRLVRATRKRNRSGLHNLHFIHADAHDFLETLSPSVIFSSIFVLFPDPWPKRRHQKNRLVRAAFLDALAKRAAPETRFYFRTDYSPYFAEVSTTFHEHPSWDIVAEPWPFEMQTVFQARASSFQSLVAARKRLS